MMYGVFAARVELGEWATISYTLIVITLTGSTDYTLLRAASKIWSVTWRGKDVLEDNVPYSGKPLRVDLH